MRNKIETEDTKRRNKIRKGKCFMKIKLSYKDETELFWLLDCLGKHIDRWKVSQNREGEYKKAYIMLRDKNIKKEKFQEISENFRQM